MANQKQKPEPISNASILMPINVDVDLVRFEKNLLQIGFFGANDARDKNRTSRRIEQLVVRNGNKIKVAAEFRGSEALGLPSTTDRDKFIALLKIVSEERVRTGSISNPIRFSGYRLIQELGLSRNGEIYEDILRWGKRMTDTTITSEQVVYHAAKKVYSDEVLHVFRSFRRSGNTSLDGADRQEHYEVVLEDWLLENLNQRYVIPEDFNAYKTLTRPTAKGIFGNLHLWFHASQGRSVEKDYSELCNLLNVQVYPHLSKIKSTMGLALNELVAIRYLSKWDIQKMSSKAGYKVVMMAGEALLEVLSNNRAGRRADATASSSAVGLLEAGSTDFSIEDQEALDLLKQHGVHAAKALKLVAAYGHQKVIETAEYLALQALSSKRRSVDNPAGLIIYSLENSLPIPTSFMTSKKLKAMEHAKEQHALIGQKRFEEETAYTEWIHDQQERAMHEQYSDEALKLKVDQLTRELSCRDERVRRMTDEAKKDVALRMLQRESSASIQLPTFQEWQTTTKARSRPL